MNNYIHVHKHNTENDDQMTNHLWRGWIWKVIPRHFSLSSISPRNMPLWNFQLHKQINKAFQVVKNKCNLSTSIYQENFQTPLNLKSILILLVHSHLVHPFHNFLAHYLIPNIYEENFQIPLNLKSILNLLVHSQPVCPFHNFLTRYLIPSIYQENFQTPLNLKSI